MDLIRISEANQNLAAKLGVNPSIHANDYVYHFLERRWQGNRDRATHNYYNLGHYGATTAKAFLDELTRVKKRLGEEWRPGSLLDFASGYGNSSRHMSKLFPDCLIGTCDIHEDAVIFNRDVLGLRSYLSVDIPEHLDLPLQDAIVVMSFFSHMPENTFTRWLQALSRSLAQGGALIFTANGYVTDKTGNTGIQVDARGFGFRPQSEQHDLDTQQYGLTISYPRYVFRAIDECPGLRLSRFQEGFWWTTQDTYVCVRE
jgi:SAM-dependent methyltransferase